MFKNSIKNKRAFTLVETLIVISIMVVLGTIAMVSVRKTQNTGLVNRGSREVISQLKRAQTLALSGENSTNVIPYYYGIEFDDASNTYRIYADQDDVAGASIPSGGDADPDTDDLVEELELPSDEVAFQLVFPENYIAFSSPNGRVLEARTEDFSITVRRTDGSESKTIVVDFVSGLIYEE